MGNRKLDKSQTVPSEALPAMNDSRRRFTKAGLGAGAVLATLASQPVLGAAPYACTISGHASGNVSSHGQPVSCAIGLSHGYWKNTKKHAWPSPFAFSQLFKDAGGAPGSLLDKPDVTTGKTLLQVLEQGGGSMIALAREVVGALLNAQQFAPNFPVSVADVKSIWNEVVTNGQYVVKPGVVWSVEEVKNYLESLHD